MTTISELADTLIENARKAGADHADAIAIQADNISIDVLDGKLEHAERAEGLDIGLRVIVGKKQATISSSDIRPDALNALAERAVAMAGVAPDDPYCGLADPSQLSEMRGSEALDIADGTAASPEQLQKMALEAETAAAAVPGVTKVQSSSAAWSGTDIWLAASNGFAGGYRRTGWRVATVAITGDGLGMERDYYGEGRTHLEDLPEAAEIGRIAGERTAARSGPTRPPTGTFPVLFDERVSSSLIEHLVGAINGSSITRGASWLKDAMGEAVLPDGMSLIEDPLRVRIGGSKPFDAEGLPTAKRAIVEDGTLRTWTLDLASARQLGLDSTANASRGTSSPPRPSVTNLELTQGDASKDDLIRDMGTGLLVTSMIGSTINPTTGDYSRGASGFWVEGGVISHPVNECTIAGNLRDMLRRIVPGNDARPELRRVVPSLLLADMTIAGA